MQLRANRDSEAYGTVEEEGPALDHLREIVARLMGALHELKNDYDSVVAELQDQCAISQCVQHQQQQSIHLDAPDISAWRAEVLSEFVRIRTGYKRQLSRERARADAAEKEARELKELFEPLPGFGEELRAIGSRYLNGDDGCNDSDVVTGIKYYEAAARCVQHASGATSQYRIRVTICAVVAVAKAACSLGSRTTRASLRESRATMKRRSSFSHWRRRGEAALTRFTTWA